MNTQRPNIIIITTDQQRTDSLSCYGSTFTDTPHLDKFASEGGLFRACVCANPGLYACPRFNLFWTVCEPSWRVERWYERPGI